MVVAGLSASWIAGVPSRSTSDETTRPRTREASARSRETVEPAPGTSRPTAPRSAYAAGAKRRHDDDGDGAVGGERRRSGDAKRRSHDHRDDERADDREAPTAARSTAARPVVVVRHARIVLAPFTRSPRHRRPVDPVGLVDPARELELDQRRSHLTRSHAGGAGQLVDARRAFGEPLRAGRRRAPRAQPAGSTARSIPYASSTSAAAVTGVAPSRSKAFDPVETADVISPGTTITSRPSSSAKSAVISAPERSRASTTTVAAQRPAMIRFLAGNRQGAGSMPGSYSDTISPLSTMRPARSR